VIDDVEHPCAVPTECLAVHKLESSFRTFRLEWREMFVSKREGFGGQEPGFGLVDTFLW
jgi:hypothetical protein